MSALRELKGLLLGFAALTSLLAVLLVTTVQMASALGG